LGKYIPEGGPLKTNSSRYLWQAAVSISIILILGCSKMATKGMPNGRIKFQTVLAAQHSLADTAGVFLCDNGGQWQKIWQLAMGQQDPMPETPKIDFGQNQVLAVFMGKKNSSGHRTEIVSITKKGKKLIVGVKNHHTAGGMLLPVVTSPFHIVTIPKGEFKLEMRYEQVTD
jgi:hypothetical protein